jgi:hypothetical protein
VITEKTTEQFLNKKNKKKTPQEIGTESAPKHHLPFIEHNNFQQPKSPGANTEEGKKKTTKKKEATAEKKKALGKALPQNTYGLRT